MTATEQEALRKLGEAIQKASFRKFASALLMIEDELGKLVPLDVNEAQIIVLDEVDRQQRLGRPVRIIICKGRQQGMSTLIQLFIVWLMLTRPGVRCLTVGHSLAAVHELYGKVDRAIRQLPPFMRPELEPGGERGRRMRFADPLRSSYRADSAAEPEGVGRGQTIQVVHLTEPPQYAKPDETAQAVLATVPDHPDTFVFVESTAKGATGWFYETYLEGQRKLERGEEPDFVPVFVPWYKTKRYARKRRPGEPPLSTGERKWRDEHGLSNEQCYWYRDQRERYGERVVEEFPSTWQEAFLSSGMPFFRRESLASYREQRRRPLRRGQFRVEAAGARRIARFTEHDGGPTHIFEEPVEGHRYTVGIDFAGGRAKDNSGIVVLDVETRAVVATHRSKELPDDVLVEALLLARAYNDAFMVPERNNMGQLLVDRLVNEWGYPNVYREDDTVAVRHHGGKRYGWATSNRTRQWLLEELAHEIHTQSLLIPDIRVTEELQTFVYSKEDGSHAAAADGSRDDMVFATALAVRGIAQVPLPKSQAQLTGGHGNYVSSLTGY